MLSPLGGGSSDGSSRTGAPSAERGFHRLDGVCLTVVDPAPDGLLFDVIQQTLDLLSGCPKGRGSGSFGTGHAGGMPSMATMSSSWRVAPSCATVKMLLGAGDFGGRAPILDGQCGPARIDHAARVSLTVAHRDETVEVALIPETLERTNWVTCKWAIRFMLIRCVVSHRGANGSIAGVDPDLLADQSSFWSSRVLDIVQGTRVTSHRFVRSAPKWWPGAVQ